MYIYFNFSHVIKVLTVISIHEIQNNKINQLLARSYHIYVNINCDITTTHTHLTKILLHSELEPMTSRLQVCHLINQATEVGTY